MYSYVLLAHVLAATVWTGGHLVLALAVLPRALKTRDPAILRDFEAGYERIGMSALVVQVASGIWLAYTFVPDVSTWFAPVSMQSRLVAMKLALLAITLLTALEARWRIIPHLSAATLPAMARRVVVVTVTSVGFVLVGVSFRGGLLS